MEENREFMEEKRDLCFKMGKLYAVGCGIFLGLDLISAFAMSIWGILGVILFIAAFVAATRRYYSDISSPFADKYEKLWANSVKPGISANIFTLVISAGLFFAAGTLLGPILLPLVRRMLNSAIDYPAFEALVIIALIFGLLIQVISLDFGMTTARRVNEESISKGRISASIVISVLLNVLTTAPLTFFAVFGRGI